MTLHKTARSTTGPGPCRPLALLLALLLFLHGAPTSAFAWSEPDPDPTLFFPLSVQLAAESGLSATIQVQLSATVSNDVTVPFTVSGTASGSGVDYTIPASPIIIAAGDLAADIPLTLIADGVAEADETVIVTLGAPTNAVLGAATVHHLTITDEELPPTDPVAPAVMPDFHSLSFAEESFSSPTDVAIDRDGRVYVVDSYANMLFRLSPDGYPIDSLEGLAAPVCVAVDESGRIYVGNKDRGNVEVYDKDFNFLFRLGSGDGEFGQARDISIDSSGTVYVVDMQSSSVRLYDSAGNFTGLLGGPGNSSGEFHLPLSIVIDEIARKIIVLDRSLGARVQFFNMDGSYLGCFYKYSTSIGGLFRPQYITVDQEHRLYISDSQQNVVLVYDSLGNYLGAVFDSSSPVRCPLGVTLSDSNRLYVASRASQNVEVYGIDDHGDMLVEPRKFRFSVETGGENPVPQSMTIHNNGTAPLTWAAVPETDWLSLSNTNGVLEQGQLASPEVAVDITGLPPGDYRGSITVSTAFGTTGDVEVILTVLPARTTVAAPRLAVTPDTLSFSSEVGTPPSPKGISIANTGSAPLHWDIYSDEDLISLSRTSGTTAAGETDADVLLLPNISSLAAGTYTETIAVFAPGAHDNTALIELTLTLTDPVTGPSPTPPPGSSWSGNHSRKWTVLAQTDGRSLNSIWGSSDSDIFAVGDRGAILHFDGLGWNEEDFSTSLNLNGVWGASAGSVYAVGESGLLLYYDGDSWSDASLAVMDSLQDVWCSSGLNCLTVGEDASVLAKDAVNSPSWSEEYSREHFGSLWGVYGFSGSDIYVVGDFGSILHYDGNEWTDMESGIGENLYGVWGSSVDNIYVVGGNGSILHYDGASWQSMESGVTVSLTAIWGNAANEVYALGEDGTMLLYTGSLWNRLDTGITVDLNDAWAHKRKEIYVVSSDGSIIFGRKSFPWALFLPVRHPGVETAPIQGEESR